MNVRQWLQHTAWRSARAGVRVGLVAALAIAAGLASAQTCTVGSGGTLSFPPFVTLARTPNQTTNTGQTLKIRCDSGVTGTLRIYSATPRILKKSTKSLPFNLSLTSGAASNDLPTASPGAAFSLTRDGLDHALILYGKVFTQDFKTLPGGRYTTSITLTVEY